MHLVVLYSQRIVRIIVLICLLILLLTMLYLMPTNSLDLNSTIPRISHDHDEDDERGNSRGHIDSYVYSLSKNSHKDSQYFTL
jgi:hypothetical protein